MNEPGAQPRDERGVERLNPRTVVLLCVLFALLAACGAAGADFLTLLLLLAASVAGALLCAFAHPALVLLPAAVAYALALLLTRSPLTALVALAALLPAAAIGFSARAKKSCAGAIVRCSACLTVLAAGLLLMALFYYEGEISGGAVLRVSERAYEYFLEYFRTVLSAVGDDGAVLITDEALSQTVRYLIATVPALLITAANLLSFLCAKLFAKFARLFGLEGKLSDPHWIFDMSLISASIFVIVTVMAFLLASSAAEPIYYAAANLQIILTPGLAVIGLRSAVVVMLRRMSRGGATIVWVLILGLCLFMFQIVLSLLSAVVTLLSVVGAVSVIRRRAPRIHLKKD